MRNSFVFLGIIFNFSLFGFTQTNVKPVPIADRPKLVIGIVVDQMRPEYIYRYWNKFGEGGFKRLVNGGFVCKNTHYNYVPTYTAPGHASIYTGTTPAVHGIIANNWFDREKNQTIYCVEDKTVKPLLAEGSESLMSPRNMLTTTITDELRLANNFKSKVIGIALKDRGAVLPAGHTANAAYWFDGDLGYFTSSTYYMKQLPQWVNQFNQQELSATYLSKPWNTLLPIEQYTESITDNNTFEGAFNNEKDPVFPHNLPEIKGKKSMDLIRSTPFGNTITKDFAVAAIKNEQLGKNSVTDFLAISFSSTDYIGHRYGPRSIEIEDTYLRLDKDLEELFIFLDKWIGKNDMLLFLTADHGVVDVVSYLTAINIPSGYIVSAQLTDSISKFLKNTYGADSLLSSYSNQQVFLNHVRLLKNKLNSAIVSNTLAEYLLSIKGIEIAITATTLVNNAYNSGSNMFTQNGFNKKRSGDICVAYAPGWVEHAKTGTTHGSFYNYDTHVPLIWYGWHIKHGNTAEHINITDIAPTISTLLDIPFPNGCTGNSIEPLMVK